MQAVKHLTFNVNKKKTKSSVFCVVHPFLSEKDIPTWNNTGKARPSRGLTTFSHKTSKSFLTFVNNKTFLKLQPIQAIEVFDDEKE